MAAGGSSRMGTSKQLLQWKGKTLIENIIDTASAVNKVEIAVVLGAKHEQIEPKLTPYQIQIIHNPDWYKGLGNSIACGVRHIMAFNEVDAIMIVLTDQPLITNNDLELLIANYEPNSKSIVATKYKDTSIGVPAIFDRFYFQQLTQLEGDKGAKSLIRAYPERVKTVTIANDLLDVDTEEAYQRLINSTNL